MQGQRFYQSRSMQKQSADANGNKNYTFPQGLYLIAVEKDGNGNEKAREDVKKWPDALHRPFLCLIEKIC